jgi:lysophospholipase L1-like esterase
MSSQPITGRPRVVSARRHFLQAGPALAAALVTASAPVRAAAAPEAWCATWGTAPAGPPAAAASTMSYANQTLRLIVHASIGGSRVRVRLTNEMGSTPLRIGAAHVGLRSSGATLVAGCGRDLSFGGRPGATIPAGAPLISDPVDLALPAFADLAISLYLPDSVQGATLHDMAQQTSYVSSTGNYAATPALPVQKSISCWPFLAEVDVLPDAGARAVVALGDSITDGARSSGNANRRWPDWLARRLQQERPAGSPPVAVVNRGVCGNCMLTDYANALIAGHDCLERFDRDVLATVGAAWLFVLIGINDIVYSPSASTIPAEDLAAGYLQLIARARLHGLRAIGATLTPFEGQAYYTPAREAVRQQVNNWIRTSGAWDGVADFDQALRDPAQPTRLHPAYDGGDHLHPNDAGYQAMAQAVPLGLFTTI